jgi:hypothetical protein
MTLCEKRDKEMEAKWRWTASAFKLKVHGLYAVFDCGMQKTHNAWRRRTVEINRHRRSCAPVLGTGNTPFPSALERPRAMTL